MTQTGFGLFVGAGTFAFVAVVAWIRARTFDRWPNPVERPRLVARSRGVALFALLTAIGCFIGALISTASR